MTSVLILAAFALILATGWALIRAFKRPATVAAPTGGDQVVLDGSPVGVLLLNPALRITWANDTFCDFFGLTLVELIGRKISRVLQQQLRGVVEEPDVVESGLLAAYAPGRKVSPFEFLVRARDGRDERWLEHTCQVIRKKPLEGGRVAYFVDITPRKNVTLTQDAQEIHLHELDRILGILARKSAGTAADEASMLGEATELAAGGLKADRCELWFLSDDRSLWTLDHLDYATPRRKHVSTPKISVPKTWPYLQRLDELRIMVTADVKSDPEAGMLLGQGRIEPEAEARLDVPIRVRGKVVGVLVFVQQTSRSWTPGEGRFAASIGDRISLIVEAGRVGRASSAAEVQRSASPPPAASSDVDGFVHLDEELRFTFLNPTVLQWLEERGLDGSTLVGRSLEESMRDVDDSSIVAEVRKAFRGGGPARLRRQLGLDGPWLDVYISPSATGVSVTLQNRASRKKRAAERSLRDSETRFRSVVESLREGLIITDLNDRIVYVNPRITELTGHRPEDLDGKHAQDLLFDAPNWTERDTRMQARREKKRTCYEAPLIDKDGNVVQVEVISTPLRDADGAVTGVIDVITALGGDDQQGLRSEQMGGRRRHVQKEQEVTG